MTTRWISCCAPSRIFKPATNQPQDKLRAVIVAFVMLMTEELHGTAAVTLDVKELSAPLRRKITAKRDRFDRAVRRIIRQGVDEGVFRSIDVKFTTFAIMGGINWIPHWFDPSGKADARAIGVAFADFFVAGLLRAPADLAKLPAPRRRRINSTRPAAGPDASAAALAQARPRRKRRVNSVP